MERDQAVKFVHDFMRAVKARGASDLFFNAGFPPAAKIDGNLSPLAEQALTAQHTLGIARAIMNDRQSAEFEATKECNFAISPAGIGRFRVNAYVQRGQAALVMRAIPDGIPTLDELGMPQKLKDIALQKRGLALVVGATGSGKSTTLAAMLDHRNANCRHHIITVEDPIEYLHPNKSSMVSQRELGSDTESWQAALKNALRQAPDVIMIGEIRDRETMEHALAYAETGHLCLASLHSNSANQALERIINFFPEDRRPQLLLDLSLNLVALLSQRLVPLKEGAGRVAAVELLLRSPYVQDLVRDGKVHELKEQMKKSRDQGMTTFDQSLFDLYESGRISEDDAVRHADSASEVRRAIKYESRHRTGGGPDSATDIRIDRS